MANAEQAFHADPSGQAFAAAVEAYRSWLRQLWAAGSDPSAAGQAAHALAGVLAQQLGSWLREAHPLASGWPGGGRHGARVQQLLGEWTAAQARLATHWAAIAQAAAQSYTARLAGSAPPLDPAALRRQYDTWVECAESAYAEVAGSQRFCEDQAALINASVALTAEVRRHADTLAHAFDLPTRTDLNALERRIQELESQARPARARKAPTARRPRRANRRARRKPK